MDRIFLVQDEVNEPANGPSIEEKAREILTSWALLHEVGQFHFRCTRETAEYRKALPEES